MRTRSSLVTTAVAALLLLTTGPISAGPSSTADFSVTMTDSLARRTTAASITNKVGGSAVQADSKAANNSATAGKGFGGWRKSGSDLSLTLIDPPQGATVSAPIDYTLRVENLGPETATGVEVYSQLGYYYADTDPFHGGVAAGKSAIFVSATSSPTCYPSVEVDPTVYLITPYVAINGEEWVRCNLGSLIAGASATVTITVIPAWVCQRFWAGAQQYDPNYANNVTTHCLP